MKLFGKHISLDVQPHRLGEPFLIGIQNWNGETDCCDDKVNVTEVGLGLITIAVIVQ